MIAYVISLFFVYYLLNYAEITRTPANWLRALLGPSLSKATTCSFCFAFWVTLFGCMLYLDFALWWCLVVPVLHLFIDLAYQRLSGNCPPCIGGGK